MARKKEVKNRGKSRPKKAKAEKIAKKTVSDAGEKPNKPLVINKEDIIKQLKQPAVQEAVKVNVGKKYRARWIYTFFFLISAIMAAFSIINIEWFSFAIFCVVMLLSIIFYGEKRKVTNMKFVSKIYLIVWITSTILASASIFFEKSLPAAIGLFVMMMCSTIARKIHISKRNDEIVMAIMEMQRSEKKNETNFDKMMEVLKKYKKVRISKFAEGFNVEKSKIEEWAQILEEHGLLVINYPAFGESELRIKKPKEKQNDAD